MLEKNSPVKLSPLINGMLDGASQPIKPNPITLRSFLSQSLGKLLRNALTTSLPIVSIIIQFYSKTCTDLVVENLKYLPASDDAATGRAPGSEEKGSRGGLRGRARKGEGRTSQSCNGRHGCHFLLSWLANSLRLGYSRSKITWVLSSGMEVTTG